MIANQVVNGSLELSKGIGIAKRTSSLTGAAAVTFGLLFVMTQLIDNDMAPLEVAKEISLPQFTPDVTEEKVRVIDIVRPVVDEAPRMKVEYALPDMAIDTGLVSLQFSDEPGSTMDMNHFRLPNGMALVPISPQFPDRAAQMGLCGQVLVQFDIGNDGVPMNVAILESSNRVFNKNALRAVQRARYKPAEVTTAGQAPMVVGKQEKITFKLTGGC